MTVAGRRYLIALVALLGLCLAAVGGIVVSAAASASAASTNVSASGGCTPGTPNCVCDILGTCSVGGGVTSTTTVSAPVGGGPIVGGPVGQPSSSPTATCPNGTWGGLCIPPGCTWQMVQNGTCALSQVNPPPAAPKPPPPPPPPPTTGQVVIAIRAKIKLPTVKIGSAPCAKGSPGCVGGAVGLPVWLWQQQMPNVADPVTINGYTLAITAHWIGTDWTMGDGHSFSCNNTGTQYQTSFGIASSPNCGYTYLTKGTYRQSATSNWSVSWTGIVNGAQNFAAPASAQTVGIGEYQVTNN